MIRYQILGYIILFSVTWVGQLFIAGLFYFANNWGVTMDRENLREIVKAVSGLTPILTEDSLMFKDFDEIKLAIKTDNEYIKIEFLTRDYETKKHIEISEIDKIKNKKLLIDTLKKEFNDIYNIRLKARIFPSYFSVKKIKNIIL